MLALAVRYFMHPLLLCTNFIKKKKPENRRTKNGEGLGTRLSDPAKTTNKQTNTTTNNNNYKFVGESGCKMCWCVHSRSIPLPLKALRFVLRLFGCHTTIKIQ